MDRTITTVTDPSIRRPLIWLLTAAAVALAGCSTDDGTVGEAAAEPASEPTEQVTSTADLDGDLAPGTYRTEGYDPNITFTVREPEPGELGWRGTMSREETQAISEEYGLDPSLFTGDTRWSIVAEVADMPYFELIRRVDPIRKATSWGITIVQTGIDGSVDEVAASLQDKQALAAEGVPEPVSVGGLEGVVFDGVTEKRGYRVGEVEFALNQRVRHFVLDVEGATRLLLVEAPADEFEEFLPEAEELLDTLRFHVSAD